MIDNSALKDLLSTKLTQVDNLLLVLACEANVPKQVAEVRRVAAEFGLPKARKWNISAILSKADGYAVRTSAGWELNGAGKHYVSNLIGTALTAPTKIAPNCAPNSLKSPTPIHNHSYQRH